jgi:hypothetical protein
LARPGGDRRWSSQAEDALVRGKADGLVLNYARGFCETSLELMATGCGVRRLKILDREIVSLEPVGRLRDSLQTLSVQADPRAALDLSALPHVRSVAGEWRLIRPTLDGVEALRSVITWRFAETDVHAFRNHFAVQRLTSRRRRIWSRCRV